MWGSVKEILNQEGIWGFFSGLIPKLLCDLTCIALASTTCYIVNKYYIRDQGNRTYFAGFIQFIYASLLYPLHVVSTCMAVTGSRWVFNIKSFAIDFFHSKLFLIRLQAGQPPNMPVYYNWSHCWKNLYAQNEHKRGSSLFWR